MEADWLERVSDFLSRLARCGVAKAVVRSENHLHGDGVGGDFRCSCRISPRHTRQVQRRGLTKIDQMVELRSRWGWSGDASPAECSRTFTAGCCEDRGRIERATLDGWRTRTPRSPISLRWPSATRTVNRLAT